MDFNQLIRTLSKKPLEDYLASMGEEKLLKLTEQLTMNTNTPEKKVDFLVVLLIQTAILSCLPYL